MICRRCGSTYCATECLLIPKTSHDFGARAPFKFGKHPLLIHPFPCLHAIVGQNGFCTEFSSLCNFWFACSCLSLLRVQPKEWVGVWLYGQKPPLTYQLSCRGCRARPQSLQEVQAHWKDRDLAQHRSVSFNIELCDLGENVKLTCRVKVPFRVALQGRHPWFAHWTAHFSYGRDQWKRNLT